MYFLVDFKAVEEDASSIYVFLLLLSRTKLTLYISYKAIFVFGVSLVRMREKYGPGKLRKRTLFTQLHQSKKISAGRLFLSINKSYLCHPSQHLFNFSYLHFLLCNLSPLKDFISLAVLQKILQSLWY